MYGPAQSGLGRYVEQLITQLTHVDTSHEYVIFLKQAAYDSFVLPSEKWKKVLADIHWYTVEEQILMPGIINREEIDLMHFPHWNVPVLYRKPFVLTIHDLIMFHHKRQEATTHGPLLYFLKDFAHRYIVRSAAKRARHIFATSEFTKQDVIRTLSIDKKKISVTYQAPYQNSEFRHACLPAGIQNSELVLKKFNIASPYVLYVGNAYPHKNLKRLIDAFRQAKLRWSNSYQLVLAGKESSCYNKLKSHIGVDPNVVVTGYVTDSELSSLYKNATLYAFPSLYEGFGLPPLEAMTHNVPVVASSASCLPEVLGEAALYFDPEDIGDIAHALDQGVRNEDIRYNLRKNAKDELARYSWGQLAKQTLTHYVL